MKNAPAIIFDLGNVLVSVDNHLSLPLLAPHILAPLDPAEQEALLYGFTKVTGWGKAGERTRAHEAYHQGNISTAEFFNELHKTITFDPAFTVEEFSQLWPARFQKKEDSLAILRSLKNYPRYMLSDTNEMDIRWIGSHFPEIFIEFDELFFSHEKNVDKYSHEAWQNVFARSGLPAHHHIFIDDKADHVARSREIGVNGIVFTSPAQLQADLTALLEFDLSSSTI